MSALEIELVPSKYPRCGQPMTLGKPCRTCEVNERCRRTAWATFTPAMRDAAIDELKRVAALDRLWRLNLDGGEAALTAEIDRAPEIVRARFLEDRVTIEDDDSDDEDPKREQGE